MYSNPIRTMIKDQEPSLTNKDVSRILGEMWRNLSSAEKAPYIEQEGKRARGIHAGEHKVARGAREG